MSLHVLRTLLTQARVRAKNVEVKHYECTRI